MIKNDKAISSNMLKIIVVSNVFPHIPNSTTILFKNIVPIIKKKLGIKDENFQVKKALYTFNSRELKNIICSAPPSIETLVVFSHNPGITNLVNAMGDRKFDNIPTTGLCVIDFEDSNWDTITSGKTLLNLFPKNLR